MTLFSSFSYLVAAIITAAATAANETIDNAVFADGLTKELYNDTNDCTSSLGISMALSLVYPSTINDAYIEMKTVLNYPSDQLQLVWNDASSSLTSRYQGRCYEEWDGECTSMEPSIEIANSVWVHDEIVLNSTYASIVGEYARQLDFQSEDAGDVVNNWVNDTTKGLIDSIVDEGPLNPAWILLAINSIYLKASWLYQFKEDNTNEDVFYADASRISAIEGNAHFMHQVGLFQYSQDVMPQFQLLQLPFAASGDSLSMIIALPLNDDGTQATTVASSVDVIAAIPSLTETRVAVALPKFRFDSRYEDNLISSFKTMGMIEPFEKGLCIEDGRCDAFIDTIIHKTFIDVNELGVEAAAVTLVAIGRGVPASPDVVLFQADHPFQFFLYDSLENVMVFEGRVGAPDIPDGSAAMLNASHADDDFWMTRFSVNAVVPSSLSSSATTTLSTPSVNASVLSSPSSSATPDALASETPSSGMMWRGCFGLSITLLWSIFVFGV